MPDKTVVDRINDFFGAVADLEQDATTPNGQVSELIGRTVINDAQIQWRRSRYAAKTVDETLPDYEFYDNLRRGKAYGYALGSLFAKRVENIYAGWILGDGVTVSLAESGDEDNENDPRNYTDQEIAKFLDNNKTTLLTTERDKFGLGDQYIIVNVDGSLSVPSPDTVNVHRNPLDYRLVEAVEVVTKLTEYEIIDRYEAFQRIVTIRSKGGEEATQIFENLIGVIPVVQVSYGISTNETNGHSVHEQLVPLYDQYDDVIFKQLDGVKLLGNPMLAFMGMEDVDQVFNLNEPAEMTTYIDKDGNEVNRQQLNIDENAVLVVGKGGSAGFVAPPTGFTADTQQALKTLFLLLLDNTGIPEFIWGNEMSSARASSDTQMGQWAKDVGNMRTYDEVWIRQVVDLWLRFRALIDPQIVVDELSADWPELVGKDVAMLLQMLQFAATEGLLTKQMLLTLLDLVDDPADAVEQAEDEADERREKMFPEGTGAQFNERLDQEAQNEEEQVA